MEIHHSVFMGAFSYAVSGYFFACRIGRYCSIGENIQAGRYNHPLDWVSTSPLQYKRINDVFTEIGSFISNSNVEAESHKIPAFDQLIKPIEIGHDVWIGHGCIIMPGVSIGTGSVIGAGSIVTKSIPCYSVAAGSPAKIIRNRFDKITQDLLMESEWWNYSINDLRSIDMRNPKEAAMKVMALRDTGAIAQLSYRPIRMTDIVGSEVVLSKKSNNPPEELISSQMKKDLIFPLFNVLIGRDPSNEDHRYWTNHIKENDLGLADLALVLRNCEDGLLSNHPGSDIRILEKAYARILNRGEYGNPNTINNSNARLFFMHIPKAAGISTIRALSSGFHPLQIHAVQYGDSTDNLTSGLIVGHYSINEIPAKRYPSDNIIALTVVRDPLKRIASLYNFLQKIDTESRYWSEIAMHSKSNSLSDFCIKKTNNSLFAIDNYYTRAFSGVGLPPDSGGDNVGRKELDMAISNITRFDEILLVDDEKGISANEATLTKIESTIGFQLHLNKERHNQSEYRDEINLSEIPEELYSLDIELLDAIKSHQRKRS
jgi:acetyltransferase-like isoleucine patch superfamily enzyme